MIVKLRKTKCSLLIYKTSKIITEKGRIADTGYGMLAESSRFKTKEEAVTYCKEVLKVNQVQIIIPSDNKEITTRKPKKKK